MRITDNLFMLSGAAYGLVGNVYAVRSQEKIILIDTGEDEAALSTIKETLVRYKLGQFPITHVLLTHMHADHAGNAWYFKEHGAAVVISSVDATGLETGGLRVNDPGGSSFQTVTADVRLQDDEEIRVNGVKFTAYYMPGHTNGSVFYAFELDGMSMIATGDTLLPVPGDFDRGFEAGLGWTGSYEFDPEKYLKTLERALAFKADVLLPGHGIPVMKNGTEAFRNGFFKAREALIHLLPKRHS